MAEPTYTLSAKVWRYPGDAGWHFVTLPGELADEIRARFEGGHIPIKAEMRRREGIENGDTITMKIEIEH